MTISRLLTALCLAAVIALAPTRASAEPGEQALPGSSLRKAGIVVTFVGIGLQVAGVGLLAAGAAIHADTNEDTTNYAIAGVWSFGLGTLALPVGIPMWAVGSSRMSRARRAWIEPFVAPTRGGLVAGLRLARF
jgi:hypothetical protein